MAEGDGLENRCALVVPGVRIPPSPFLGRMRTPAMRSIVTVANAFWPCLLGREKFPSANHSLNCWAMSFLSGSVASLLFFA